MYMGEKIRVIHTFVMLSFSIWWENIFIIVALYWSMCNPLFDFQALQY